MYVKRIMSLLALAGMLGWGAADRTAAQSEAAPSGATKIELSQGTRARYKVAERLVGVDFGNDTTGTTEAVTGVIVIDADGSIDASQSNLTVDLRTLTSDQQFRDMYLQSNVLETETYPLLEFVPRRAVGMPFPLPMGTKIPNSDLVAPQAAGFSLIGDMTLHGVTQEVTWTVVSTISAESVSGQASTSVTFSTFGLSKPAVRLLASADDNIRLEVEFRATRSAM